MVMRERRWCPRCMDFTLEAYPHAEQCPRCKVNFSLDQERKGLLMYLWRRAQETPHYVKELWERVTYLLLHPSGRR